MIGEIDLSARELVHLQAIHANATNVLGSFNRLMEIHELLLAITRLHGRNVIPALLELFDYRAPLLDDGEANLAATSKYPKEWLGALEGFDEVSVEVVKQLVIGAIQFARINVMNKTACTIRLQLGVRTNR